MKSKNQKKSGVDGNRKLASIKKKKLPQKNVPGNKKVFKCNLCDHTTSSQGNLMRHIMVHTSEKPYKCEFCDHVSSKKGNLMQHILVHTGEKPYKCELCDYVSSAKSNLMQHILVHTGEKPYKCQKPNCKAEFSDPASCKRHELVHQDKNDANLQKFECSICPYKAIRKCNFNDHMKTHSDVREFSCDLCPYKATSKDYIRSHKKYLHSTEKLQCPQPGCQYSCPQRKTLTRHLKTHLKIRQPFVCSFAQCDFQTMRKLAFRDHEMGHRGVKLFNCSICSFACNYETAFAAHTVRHSREKSHPCQSCSFRAKTAAHLARHARLIHPGKKSNTGCSKTTLLHRKTSLKCKVRGCEFSTQQESCWAVHLNEAHDLPRVALTKLEISIHVM